MQKSYSNPIRGCTLANEERDKAIALGKDFITQHWAFILSIADGRVRDRQYALP
ncbi:MAG: hypothetical protein WCD18_24355 [Thermosynechococcaceae cyanobacterium]